MTDLGAAPAFYASGSLSRPGALLESHNSARIMRKNVRIKHRLAF
jgi:hypothetical protein